MKSKKIDEHVKSHYQSQLFDEKKLNKLLEMGEVPKADASFRQLVVVKSHFSWVASFVFIAVVFWGYFNFEQNQALKNNLTQLISQEIALNHNKQLKLDFEAKNYESLNQAMAKLDFTISKSQHANLAELEIVGARYCSIQGKIATQIRLKNKDGKYFTLYQTKLTELLKKNPAVIQRIQQVEVHQWQEDGLFFGLAESFIPIS